MTKIKICGLRRKEDAIWANALLPDYVGFVFAESKRKVRPSEALGIKKELDGRIKTVGVFVNPTPAELDAVLSECPLDIIQLHGDERPEFCNNIGIPVWKAFRIKAPDDLTASKPYDVDAYLFDGYHPSTYGGMGQGFDWDMLHTHVFNRPIIIAGGINDKNVQRLIETIHPMAVDVSSSVETNGYKDAVKIERLIKKVRNNDGEKQ